MSNRYSTNPRLAYRQAAVETATPLGLVVILYDLVIEDFAKAIAAIGSGDVEARTAAVHHALSVLEQLQGRLDFEKGGDVARQLDGFYSMIRGKMLEAQMKCSREIFGELMAFISDMRRAWKQIEEHSAAPGTCAPESDTQGSGGVVPKLQLQEAGKTTWSA
jgi:flagellar secretion chaperone FliS